MITLDPVGLLKHPGELVSYVIAIDACEDALGLKHQLDSEIRKRAARELLSCDRTPDSESCSIALLHESHLKSLVEDSKEGYAKFPDR